MWSCKAFSKENIKAMLWYLLEAAAITGMAFPIGFLSYHIQRIVNDYLVGDLCWEQKLKSICDYCDGANPGMIIEIAIFFVALFVYVAVRGHADSSIQKDIQGIKDILDSRLPAKERNTILFETLKENISLIKDMRKEMLNRIDQLAADKKDN